MNRGFIKLQRNLLSLPKVADMYAVEGATGLGLYVSINLYLSHCEGGWGVYSGRQMSVLAYEGHRRRSEVKRLINDYDLFVVDNKRFTSHWMQQQFDNDANKMPKRCSTPARTNYPRAEEIEIKIEKENKEKADVRVSADTHTAESEESTPIGPSAYESVDRDGMRHGGHDELVPWWAPPQTDVYAVWSMLEERWVALSHYDAKAERQRRNEMQPEDFMMKTAWEKLDETEHNRIQDYAKRR